MILKMSGFNMSNNKRFRTELDEFKYKNEHTPFTLGTLSVMFLFFVAIIVATFTSFNLSHFWFSFNENGLALVSKHYFYIAQIPVIVFMAAILGIRYSILTLILYVLIGLFWMPIFGLGGGLSYIKTYPFGYVLGYFPCVIFAGFLLRKYKGYLGVLLASLTSVSSVYITGFLYGILLLLFRFIDFSFLKETFNDVNLTKFLYDFVVSFLFILFSHLVKKILWVAMRSDFVKKEKTHKENKKPEKKRKKKPTKAPEA